MYDETCRVLDASLMHSGAIFYYTLSPYCVANASSAPYIRPLPDLPAKGVLKGPESRLLSIVEVVDACGTFTGKDTGDPAGLVSETPYEYVSSSASFGDDTERTDGDTGAEIIVETSLDNVRVVLSPGPDQH